ncbi:hypothetical protein IQ283_10160 [Alkalihalobacillus hwajinpoensis]|nr:hypothetical protein [Pseudalkalibacillus hwajinpoensis]MBF0706954.1 hypothetical protein [Pseudalkalibacillus hwajinpoensis]
MENYEGNLRYQPYMSVSFSFERMIYSFKPGEVMKLRRIQVVALFLEN